MTDGPQPSPPDDWPDPHDRNCADCGHVWFAGERRHHYADVEAAGAEASDVVCVLCRRQRERPRADDERWDGWEPPFGS